MSSHSEFPIITKLGGRKTVERHLQAAALITKRDTVRMWYARKRISGQFVLELMRLADSNDISYDARDFELPKPTAETRAASEGISP